LNFILTPLGQFRAAKGIGRGKDVVSYRLAARGL